jgi:hypothetical protein
MLKPMHLSRQLYLYSVSNTDLPDLSASDDGDSDRSAWNRRVGQQYGNQHKYSRNNGFGNFGPEKIHGRLIHRRKHRNTWMKDERYDHLPRRWEDVNMVRESWQRMLPMSSSLNHHPTVWSHRKRFEERIRFRDYQSMVRIGNWKSPALIDGLIQVITIE